MINESHKVDLVLSELFNRRNSSFLYSKYSNVFAHKYLRFILGTVFIALFLIGFLVFIKKQEKGWGEYMAIFLSIYFSGYTVKEMISFYRKPTAFCPNEMGIYVANQAGDVYFFEWESLLPVKKEGSVCTVSLSNGDLAFKFIYGQLPLDLFNSPIGRSAEWYKKTRDEFLNYKSKSIDF